MKKLILVVTHSSHKKPWGNVLDFFRFFPWMLQPMLVGVIFGWLNHHCSLMDIIP
jgi:hypothetical protein